MPKKESPINFHKKHRGKLEIRIKTPLKTKNDFSLIYTPGVGKVSLAISKNKKLVDTLTCKKNKIAIVTDGSAVLGFGNIGPEAAIPVMEGKAVIFKAMANINAITLAIKAKTANEIVKFIKQIEPSFAGINLEDIASPKCFEVTEKLENQLSIPFFHDDQDGTAIAVLAALLNATKILKKDILRQKIVINGAGAAGLATANLLYAFGIKNLTVLDSKGIIAPNQKNLNKYKKRLAKKINKNKISGNLKDALKDSNIFIGLSKGNALKKELIKLMSKNPVIFAMANPVPEIRPKEAFKAGAVIVGTGRSDYPNQINNAIVFPGLFKGLIENNIIKVTTKIKIYVARILANSINPSKNRLLPGINNKKIVNIIASSLAKFKNKKNA